MTGIIMADQNDDNLTMDGLEGTVIWKEFADSSETHGDSLCNSSNDIPNKPTTSIVDAITQSQENTGDTVIQEISENEFLNEKKMAAMIEEGRQLQIETNKINHVMSNACSNHRIKHYRIYGVRIEFTDQIYILNRHDIVEAQLSFEEHQFDTWYSLVYHTDRPTSGEFVAMEIGNDFSGNASYLKYELDSKILAMRDLELRLSDWILDDLYDASGDELNYFVLNSLYDILADTSDILFLKPATLQKQYVLNRLKGLKLTVPGYEDQGLLENIIML